MAFPNLAEYKRHIDWDNFDWQNNVVIMRIRDRVKLLYNTDKATSWIEYSLVVDWYNNCDIRGLLGAYVEMYGEDQDSEALRGQIETWIRKQSL